MDHEEPVPETSYRKKYLVLFDTVPGGTGYLKQLMRSPEPLMDVLQRVLDVLKACSCRQDPAKDGCYRCLYAYKYGNRLPAISRERAMEQLSAVLDRRDKLVRVESLKHVPVTGLLESELEALFIEALRRSRARGRRVSLKKGLVRGKPGYYLKIDDEAYLIEPQVELGASQGVAEPSRADFVFRPLRESRGIKPIVVFADGFAYHRKRVGLDLAQPMALVQSGRFRVWSLTWHDVQARLSAAPAAPHYVDLAGSLETNLGKNLGQVCRMFGVEDLGPLRGDDGFSWLLAFLAEPDADRWSRFAHVCGLSLINGAAGDHAMSREAFLARLPRENMADAKGIFEDVLEIALLGIHPPDPEDARKQVQMFVAAGKEAVRLQKPEDLRLLICLEDGSEQQEADGFQAAWNGGLRAYNLFHFVPRTLAVAARGWKRASTADC
ncbi:MAG: DUF1998 domain-containing protein [Desulfosoma sp.]